MFIFELIWAIMKGVAEGLLVLLKIVGKVLLVFLGLIIGTSVITLNRNSF